MTIIFLATAQDLAGAFVPEGVRNASLTYVRLSSVQALTSALETSISASTRALDNPDVPLIISSIKVFINIILDLLVIFQGPRRGLGSNGEHTSSNPTGA